MAALFHLLKLDLVNVNMYKVLIVLIYTVPALLIFVWAGTWTSRLDPRGRQRPRRMAGREVLHPRRRKDHTDRARRDIAGDGRQLLNIFNINPGDTTMIEPASIKSRTVSGPTGPLLFLLCLLLRTGAGADEGCTP